ncbi:MAG: acetolactate synthase small subunit, partial [Methanobacteriaceae archaeon]|nr:acetolactate synthase small subunit [Methanobacteriaceae archaeon]
MEHVISTLVENKPGVLQKVTGLVSRRGYNIESITVGECEVPDLARMVFVVKGDQKVLEQVTKQLNKLVEVVKVKDLDPNNSVKRELALIKVKTEDDKIRSEIIQYANIFRGKIIDVCDDSLTIEITGSPDKIDALISLLKPFGIKKIARTGPTAV